jgi:hypothetical protein
MAVGVARAVVARLVIQAAEAVAPTAAIPAAVCRVGRTKLIRLLKMPRRTWSG